MVLDFLAGVLILMVAVLGWRSGALGSLVRIAALGGALALSRPLGAALRPEVSELLPDHPSLVGSLAALLAGAGLWLVFVTLGSIVARFLRGSPTLQGADRLMGLVLGTTKGALLAYGLLCFCVALERPLTEAFPGFGDQLRASATADIARTMNMVDWLLEESGPQATDSASKSSATPPVPGPPTTRWQTARTSGGAPRTATPTPAAWSASRSL